MADQGSEGILSPFLRRQRLNAARPFLKGKVLDVGCGVGLLADEIPPERYLGIEVDPISLEKAISNFPRHQFQATLPLPTKTGKFDTVIALAVIEHVKSPEQFLTDLSAHLSHHRSARIIITTPHPSMDWVHDFGATIGLFSKRANEEHEELLNHAKLNLTGTKLGLRLISYKRFLFGANQLAVYEFREPVKEGSSGK